MVESNLASNAFSENLTINNGIFLPNLEFLLLVHNQLTGNIPSSLCNSSKLTMLILAANLFTGPVPKYLGNLIHLEHLTNCTSLEESGVGQNKLSGALPNSIGNLSNSLRKLSVSESIPKEIGSLRNVNVLALANSNLNGNIPSTLGEIESLQRLYLGGNNFHGSIPNEICLLRNLGELYAEQNKLSGSIPSCIENLRGLQVIKLSHNKLAFIPSSLWNLETLRYLNLSLNSLGGSLDPNIRPTRVIQIVDLSWNQISGSILRVIGSFQSLISLNLSRKSFSRPIPNTIGNLITLDFLVLGQSSVLNDPCAMTRKIKPITFRGFWITYKVTTSECDYDAQPHHFVQGSQAWCIVQQFHNFDLTPLTPSYLMVDKVCIRSPVSAFSDCRYRCPMASRNILALDSSGITP
ncbi:hypothetical protein HYC85_030460 [Camellia sinensis]|uniref:Uncharacterized protein n=1 Tax=Camellia sinensis TaxID=4442 RepID=A0A7J7G0Z7_CAMSI|nr:hypothetical protein HYC85_030460 [Camellia sinensis]